MKTNTHTRREPRPLRVCCRLPDMTDSHAGDSKHNQKENSVWGVLSRLVCVFFWPAPVCVCVCDFGNAHSHTAILVQLCLCVSMRSSSIERLHWLFIEADSTRSYRVLSKMLPVTSGSFSLNWQMSGCLIFPFSRKKKNPIWAQCGRGSEQETERFFLVLVQ